jgi:hypothetical protein
VGIPIPYTPPHVSLNRVRVVDLPGIAVDSEVRGQVAYDLLSGKAITRYAREWADPLGLPSIYCQDSAQTRLDLPRYVAACLQAPRTEARQAAQAIGRRLGRNLGHILLALHRGDRANREARPDWTAADWDRWARIKRVWLGGGMVSDPLGQLILHHARDFLVASGQGDFLRVELSPYQGDVALLGAARYLPPSTRHSVCLDLGQTLVKRACLTVTAGTITRARHYPSLAPEWDELGDTGVPDAACGQQVLDFVVDTIVQTLHESEKDGLDAGEDMMLSVAAYVRGGRPLGTGPYAQMGTLAADTQGLLADAVARRIGKTVRAHLIHDGTAAAALYAGVPQAAVITVGTALGIGFPPINDEGLRALSLPQ